MVGKLVGSKPVVFARGGLRMPFRVQILSVAGRAGNLTATDTGMAQPTNTNGRDKRMLCEPSRKHHKLVAEKEETARA